MIKDYKGLILGSLLWNVIYDGLLNLDLSEESELVGFLMTIIISGDDDNGKNCRLAGCSTHETIRKANNWLYVNGLKLPINESIIISKRAFDSPALTYERKIVSCIKSVRYTSLQIDARIDQCREGHIYSRCLIPYINGLRSSRLKDSWILGSDSFSSSENPGSIAIHTVNLRPDEDSMMLVCIGSLNNLLTRHRGVGTSQYVTNRLIGLQEMGSLRRPHQEGIKLKKKTEEGKKYHESSDYSKINNGGISHLTLNLV
ncbi:LOW QUALITY PROTEIN: putative 115 kDa protein in type-1 retrotransposable element R1DM [Vespula maculifrons]|uniref:115 kDa protein in type-1 retrotransposable element R1DM n=1 Tax=Vespula maculifrons TaxID=7453 RepID=A0ABD2C7T7_VESMC